MNFSINLKNITKKYDNSTIIHYKNLEVKKTGFTIIQGDSGCGKSTLFNLLSGVDRKYNTFENSQFCVCGLDFLNAKKSEIIKMRRNKVGFVFQDYDLLQDFTIEENLRIYDSKKNDINDKIKKFFKELSGSNPKLFSENIDAFKKKFPFEISGGQKQRVALLRALSHEPEIILADEPTSNIDSTASKDVLETLYKSSSRSSIVIITHDENVLEYLNDKEADIDHFVFEKDSKNGNFVMDRKSE